MNYTQMYVDLNSNSHFNIQNLIFDALGSYKAEIESFAKTAYDYGYNGKTFGSNLHTLKEVKAFKAALKNKLPKQQLDFLVLDIFLGMRNKGSCTALTEGIR